MLVKNASPADQMAILTGEHLVFSLLGKAFFEYPDKNWIETVAAEAIFEDIPFAQQQPDMKTGAELLQTWSHENQRGLTKADFHALTADYTHLFIGPGEVLAPPWESVYFNDERLTFQEQTLQVRSWFRRYGVESIKLKSEPDDHAGLEFAFLAHMAQLGILALEQKDEKAFEQAVEGQAQFLSEHPLKWIALFWVDLILEHAQTNFYRGLALVARGALLDLSRVLAVPLAEGVQS